MRCKNCGREIGPNIIACEHCGTAIEDSKLSQSNTCQNNNINSVGTTDNSALIGLIFIIAGIVMAIITIIYLVKIDNSTITYRYSSNISSMAINI